MALTTPPIERLAALGPSIGVPEWSDDQFAALEQYAVWLTTEAVVRGGIGPAEGARIWDRHILDSLVFGIGLPPNATVLDVGTGVGLPGILIAIARPKAHVTLLDRAGRRIDGLHRILSILDIDVAVEQADVRNYTGSFDRVVLRASLPITEALTLIPPLTATQGEIWFGLGRGADSKAMKTWQSSPAALPASWNAELVDIPDGVLDSPSWLLRIGRW